MVLALRKNGLPKIMPLDSADSLSFIYILSSFFLVLSHLNSHHTTQCPASAITPPAIAVGTMIGSTPNLDLVWKRNLRLLLKPKVRNFRVDTVLIRWTTKMPPGLGGRPNPDREGTAALLLLLLLFLLLLKCLVAPAHCTLRVR